MNVYACLMASVGICAFLSYVGLTEAIIFYHFPIFPRELQPSNSDPKEMNDNYNRILPLPPIFPSFGRRNLDSFFHIWDKERKKDAIVTTLESIERNKEKVDANDSLDIKQKNITEPPKDQLRKTRSHFASNHEETTESTETSSKLHNEYTKNDTDDFLNAFPFLHARFLRVHRLPYSPFENIGKGKNDEAGKSTENSNWNVSQLTSTLNSTSGNENNGLEMDNNWNCTYRQFILRHISIWTFNWASLGLHLAVIMLLSVFVSAGLLLCHSYFVTHQSRSAFLKAKPLNV